MDKKYRIGFFATIFTIVLLLCLGYRASYNHAADRQFRLADERTGNNMTDAEKMKEKKGSLLATEGAAAKNEGFYLKELQGYVAVYYQDKETLYELTDIPVATLPEELKIQLSEGKYLKNEKELYGFLENYSS